MTIKMTIVQSAGHYHTIKSCLGLFCGNDGNIIHAIMPVSHELDTSREPQINLINKKIHIKN